MKRVYLDHTATTPVDPGVTDAMLPYFSGQFGNASSVHWYGREAKTALEKARETLARALGAEPGEMIFTSGGTESDNLAIRGVAHAARRARKNHIITSAAEHHAVLESCEQLAEEGFRTTILPVDEHGLVVPGRIPEALTDATCLISIIHANNEVGSISQMREIVDIAHRRGIVVHTDAVQSVGKIPVSVDELGVDLMTLSAHKMYGPKGIGALYVRKGTAIDPLLVGGGQERGRRPGTENVPLAVGMARAMELAMDEMPAESGRLRRLRDMLESMIREAFPDVIVNGHPHHRLPHILNISFDSDRRKIEGEMLLMNMDLEGIAVTSGSACASGSMQPSHVLLAMGRNAHTAKATLRFAFGKSNTEEDVQIVVGSLRRVVERMSK